MLNFIEDVVLFFKNVADNFMFYYVMLIGAGIIAVLFIVFLLMRRFSYTSKINRGLKEQIGYLKNTHNRIKSVVKMSRIFKKTSNDIFNEWNRFLDNKSSIKNRFSIKTKSALNILIMEKKNVLFNVLCSFTVLLFTAFSVFYFDIIREAALLIPITAFVTYVILGVIYYYVCQAEKRIALKRLEEIENIVNFDLKITDLEDILLLDKSKLTKDFFVAEKPRRKKDEKKNMTVTDYPKTSFTFDDEEKLKADNYVSIDKLRETKVFKELYEDIGGRFERKENSEDVSKRTSLNGERENSENVEGVKHSTDSDDSLYDAIKRDLRKELFETGQLNTDIITTEIFENKQQINEGEQEKDIFSQEASKKKSATAKKPDEQQTQMIEKLNKSDRDKEKIDYVAKDGNILVTVEKTKKQKTKEQKQREDNIKSILKKINDVKEGKNIDEDLSVLSDLLKNENENSNLNAKLQKQVNEALSDLVDILSRGNEN